MATHIYLTGFMGAGKTTVGESLADWLDWDFVDLDGEVVRRTGRPIEEIFEADGELGFRRLEIEALEGLDAGTDRVVATGGGFPVEAANRERMRARGVVVWLDVDFETAWGRIASSSRPLARDRGAARKLFDGRREAYGDCDFRVGGDAGPPSEMAAEIDRWFRERTTR